MNLLAQQINKVYQARPTASLGRGRDTATPITRPVTPSAPPTSTRRPADPRDAVPRDPAAGGDRHDGNSGRCWPKRSNGAAARTSNALLYDRHRDRRRDLAERRDLPGSTGAGAELAIWSKSTEIRQAILEPRLSRRWWPPARRSAGMVAAAEREPTSPLAASAAGEERRQGSQRGRNRWASGSRAAIGAIDPPGPITSAGPVETSFSPR